MHAMLIWGFPASMFLVHGSFSRLKVLFRVTGWECVDSGRTFRIVNWTSKYMETWLNSTKEIIETKKTYSLVFFGIEIMQIIYFSVIDVFCIIFYLYLSIRSAETCIANVRFSLNAGFFLPKHLKWNILVSTMLHPKWLFQKLSKI